ncbi:MAG: DUF2461 domain-containing protein [Saprospiraceae bacterium]|nr:DUF2461 domain-containing protein [Saprospiraceae bacterium]
MLSPEYTKFFRDLSDNNNREWFNRNKTIFKTEAETMFKGFIKDLIDSFSNLMPDYKNLPEEAIFRIYKDVRFSKDKTPYKTYMSALLSTGGRKSMEKAGWYIEVHPERIDFYAGVYQPDSANLLRIRNHISRNFTEFNSIINEQEFKKHFGEIIGEKSKILPAHLKSVAQSVPEIYNKAFYIIGCLKENQYDKSKLIQDILVKWKLTQPFIRFLSETDIKN